MRFILRKNVQYVNKTIQLSFMIYVRKKPKSCLVRVFNYKLGCFGNKVHYLHFTHTATSTADNLA